MEIQHWSHPQHPLRLRDDNNNNNKILSILCNMCWRNIVGPFYVCEACGYYAHKSCAELPHQINHHFHPSDPLTLRIGISAYCDSCDRLLLNSPFYRCSTCNFFMDVECALMRSSTASSTTSPDNQVQSIGHSTHPHMLLLVDTQEYHKCVVCSEYGSGGVYYGCSRCNYFVHRQCLNQLPQQTKYPLHRHHHHHLALRYRSGSPNTCSSCKKYLERNGFTFRCCQCHFQLCLTCGTTVNIRHIKYEDHDHLLSLVEKTDTPIDQCDGYDVYCKLPSISNSSEINFTRSSSILSCLDCDFKIHLLCGLLPFMIKHECHIHSLILVDSLVEDDIEEYYCDVCETKRNLRVRVYHCKECKYIAHVHCVISEVIKVLRGDHPTNVELKSIGEDVWKLSQQEKESCVQNIICHEDQQVKSHDPLTFKDLLDKLTQDELSWFTEYFEWDTSLSSSEDNKRRDQEVISAQHDDDELIRDEDNINELLQFSNFTELNLNDLISTFTEDFYEGGYKLKIKSRDLKLKLVDLKGYKVPFVVALVLTTLFHKYGDISQKSECSLEIKSIMFFFLCKVMKGIHITLYTDITRSLLLDWYFYIEFASCRGKFDISFLEAPVEKITRAFFCLQASKLEMEVPTAINKKIAELQNQITENKAKLEMCTKFRESSKEKVMKDLLEEATKLKWKTPGKVLF